MLYIITLNLLMFHETAERKDGLSLSNISAWQSFKGTNEPKAPALFPFIINHIDWSVRELSRGLCASADQRIYFGGVWQVYLRCYKTIVPLSEVIKSAFLLSSPL